MTNVLESSREPQPSAISPELRWSLAHEWSHVARGDVRVWSFAGLVRLVYYYQPLCWWSGGSSGCVRTLADAVAGRVVLELHAEASPRAAWAARSPVASIAGAPDSTGDRRCRVQSEVAEPIVLAGGNTVAATGVVACWS